MNLRKAILATLCFVGISALQGQSENVRGFYALRDISEEQLSSLIDEGKFEEIERSLKPTTDDFKKLLDLAVVTKKLRAKDIQAAQKLSNYVFRNFQSPPSKVSEADFLEYYWKLGYLAFSAGDEETALMAFMKLRELSKQELPSVEAKIKMLRNNLGE